MELKNQVMAKSLERTLLLLNIIGNTLMAAILVFQNYVLSMPYLNLILGLNILNSKAL